MATFSLPTSQRETALAQLRQINGPSQLGQRAESAGQLSVFEERIYSVFNSSFDVEQLVFYFNVGTHTRRRLTLQNITINE